MPSIAKNLSDDEKLELAHVEAFTPEYISQMGNEAELDQVLYRIMNPHAFAARSEYEKRKTEQKKREEWLHVIVNNQNSLRQTQSRIKQLVDGQKGQNTAAGSTGSLSR